jgi:flavorubredoxin
MKTIEVAPGVHRLHAEVPESTLFEGMWPIPHGMTMNSYLVRGERVALVDGVCGWDGVPETLHRQLGELGFSAGDIAYAVLNHLEPDHTGWLAPLRALNRSFELVTTAKGAELLDAFFGMRERVRVVKSGDRLTIGGGRELVFEETPNVHWPETMMSFEVSSGTLFSGDAFGSFGSAGDSPFDEGLTGEKLAFFEEETLRYFANVIAYFSAFVQKALAKLERFDVRIVAPAHGLVWRRDPGRIIELYRRLAGYSGGPAEPEIALVWGSMYGNTEKAVARALEGARAEGVPVRVHQVPRDHVSYVLASAWRASGLILGMPTYEFRMFPPMAHALDELGRKRVVGKKVFRFGSFGWSGGAQKELEALASAHKWELLPPVEFKGLPGERDLELVRERSAELARMVKAHPAARAVSL